MQQKQMEEITTSQVRTVPQYESAYDFRVAVLCHLNETGAGYLKEQASKVQQRFGGRGIGSSGILRGVVNGLAACGFDLSDSPTPYHVASKVAAVLRGEGVRQ